MDRKRRYFLCLGGAALLVILLAGAGLCLGEMPLRQALDSGILWRLRLPRIATALLAGAALALGGAQMQALFRNPLADPHIMGVSGGAGLGAALAATVTAGAALPIAGAAFLGALAASALILFTATRVHSGTPLLIFGVMLGFILSALTSVVEGVLYLVGGHLLVCPAARPGLDWQCPIPLHGPFPGRRPGPRPGPFRR